jgi:hypothetical protein
MVERATTEGLAPEELQTQAAGLLPDRVEMRRKRGLRRRSFFGFHGDDNDNDNNSATFVQINSTAGDFEPGGTSFSS